MRGRFASWTSTGAKQKKLFLDLENHSIKIERDSNVYKENYERLIIENNELKTKLRIAKEQIVNYETNKTNLLLALDQLNEILAKSNIVGNISPQKSFLDVNNLKKAMYKKNRYEKWLQRVWWNLLMPEQPNGSASQQ